jgi:hypothetical protein
VLTEGERKDRRRVGADGPRRSRAPPLSFKRASAAASACGASVFGLQGVRGNHLRATGKLWRACPSWRKNPGGDRCTRGNRIRRNYPARLWLGGEASGKGGSVAGRGAARVRGREAGPGCQGAAGGAGVSGTEGSTRRKGKGLTCGPWVAAKRKEWAGRGEEREREKKGAGPRVAWARKEERREGPRGRKEGKRCWAGLTGCWALLPLLLLFFSFTQSIQTNY